MKNNSFKEIEQQIMKSENILITAHISPDGDAIGSGLALLLTLKKMGKSVEFILEDKVPKSLEFLENIELVKIFDSSKVEETNYDLMICLDSGNWDRIGKVSLLKNKNTKVINIDHHISNTQFGDYNYVDYISSTSEIIFNFIQDRKYEINLPIAYSIYTGLVNDTGNFKHSNTTKEVFEIAAQLVGYGVQPNEVIKNFFDTKSMGRIKLIGETLSNFKLVDSLNLVYYYISEQKLEKLGALSEDTSGLGEMLLSYEKASVSLILRESDGMIKGSFRSKNEVDVNRLASFFNGGGHIKAAGFKTDKSVEEILETIKKELNN